MWFFKLVLNMLELCRSDEFVLTLDPVEVEEKASSVSFDVVAEMNLSYQRARIEFQSCWIKMDALKRFEARLDELLRQESGSVVLANNRKKPVITINRAGDDIDIIVEATDTMGYGKARMEVPGYASELEGLLGRIRDYPKTW